MKILMMKATPYMILELLKCVERNEGNIPDMKRCIHSYLQGLSSREEQRNIRSDVYGIALPSLRKLELTIGRGRFLQLNSNGKLLLRSNSSLGFSEFKYQFGRILYEIDKEKCKVVPSLLKASNQEKENAVTYKRLVSALLSNGVETHEKDERLRKWLPFLEYVDLIEKTGKTSFRVNVKLIENYKLKKPTAPFQSFEEILFEEYEKLEATEGIYVPIYKLVISVCDELIERGYFFNTYDFKASFITLLNKYRSLERKKILLSQPGKREEEGIYIADTYYYFISIYDTKEENA
jgi:hypothetical protein